MKQGTIISARNISIGYHKKKAKLPLFDDLSFDLYTGELICLVGSNGAGKSTLLRSISGLQPLLNGNIYIRDKNLNRYTERTLSKIIGLVLTDKTSTGGLTVRELVELGRYPYTGFFGQLSDSDKVIVEKAMTDVGIFHKADSYMAELSDGERQKVMIAKVLAQECPIILLDEPTAFLDIESRTEIIGLLHTLALIQNKTILLSTHDIDLALHLSDRLFLLSKEKGLRTGVTEDIILSGLLDNFFSNKIITFDKTSGSFIPKHTSGKPQIYVETNHTLQRWVESFFNKKGYIISTNKEDKSLFSIKLSSPTSILVEEMGRAIELQSFGELDKWIRERMD